MAAKWRLLITKAGEVVADTDLDGYNLDIHHAKDSVMHDIFGQLRPEDKKDILDSETFEDER